jgi:hypothetical protein
MERMIGCFLHDPPFNTQAVGPRKDAGAGEVIHFLKIKLK